jgi:hypothetical protein
MPSTLPDYAAIARSVEFKTKAFINGRFVDAVSGKTFETANPATGKAKHLKLASQMQGLLRRVTVTPGPRLKHQKFC